MPIQEYECPRKHVTTRMISLAKSPGPGYVKCSYHKGTGNSGSTHYEGCGGPKGSHTCGLRAKRHEVYRVGVGGDLPTRGAF
jgi:hypothetical protein